MKDDATHTAPESHLSEEPIQQSDFSPLPCAIEYVKEEGGREEWGVIDATNLAKGVLKSIPSAVLHWTASKVLYIVRCYCLYRANLPASIDAHDLNACARLCVSVFTLLEPLSFCK